MSVGCTVLLLVDRWFDCRSSGPRGRRTTACHTAGRRRPRPAGAPAPCPRQRDDERVERQHVPAGRATRRRRRRPAPRRAGPGGGRRPARRQHLARRGRPAALGAAPPAGPRPAASRASASSREQVGGAGQGRRDAGPERVLEHGQRGAAPGPGRRRGSALCGSSHGVSPSAAQAARVVARGRSSSGRRQRPAPRRHPGQRPGARAPGQPEQHGLGLVVEGVPEQHRGRAVLGGGRVEGRVARRPGRRPRARRRRRRPPPRRDRRPGRARGSAQRPRPRSAPRGRAGLQPVVDDHRAGRARPPAAPRTPSRRRAPGSRRRRCRRRARARPSGRSAQRRAGRRPRTAATAGAGPLTPRLRLSAWTRRDPGRRVGDLGRAAAASPARSRRALKPSMPTAVDDLADEPGAVAVLPHLGLEAEQPAQHAGRRRRGRRGGAVNRSRICSTEGTTCGPTSSMTTSAWPSSSDITAVSRPARRAARGLDGVEQGHARALAAHDGRARSRSARPSRSRELRRARAAGRRPGRGLRSTRCGAQPRGRRRTAPGGSPRAGRPRAGSRRGSTSSSRSTATTLGATSSSRAVGPGEGVVLAQHAGRQEAEQAADLDAR